MYILYFFVEINRQEFLKSDFNTRVESQGIPLFPISTILHVIISKQDIHIC
jgi:hypothetical protein